DDEPVFYRPGGRTQSRTGRSGPAGYPDQPVALFPEVGTGEVCQLVWQQDTGVEIGRIGESEKRGQQPWSCVKKTSPILPLCDSPFLSRWLRADSRPLLKHGPYFHRHQARVLAPPLRQLRSLADHPAVTANLDLGHADQPASRYSPRHLSRAEPLSR